MTIITEKSLSLSMAIGNTMRIMLDLTNTNSKDLSPEERTQSPVALTW